MYIYSFSNHIEVVEEALSNKKEHLKKRVNRADNFVNLTLLGVEKCLKEISLKSNTNLYIASNDGNINSTIKILDAIFRKNRLPMPFNFLNSVNASILFFVAKNFGIEGKGIFVDKFESALVQAYVDVKNGKTVLLGEVNEAIADLKLHKIKFHTEIIKENSSWLLLSPHNQEGKALAQISDFKLEKQETQDIKSLFDFLERKEESQHIKGENLSFIIAKC